MGETETDQPELDESSAGLAQGPAETGEDPIGEDNEPAEPEDEAAAEAFYVSTREAHGDLTNEEKYDTLEEAVVAAEERDGVAFVTDGPIADENSKVLSSHGSD